MSNDIKNALEHCIDNNCVDCPNNEELGSGEFVCNARLLPKVLAHITNLEVKLEESERLIERLQQIVNKLRDKKFAGETLVNAVNAVYEPLYQNKYDEVKELKHQLEEKEKQHIEAMQNALNDFLTLRQKLNQDKIEFAVEQLEKVKEWVDKMFNGWKTNKEVNQLAKDGICLSLENVGYKIDNQINQLKEGK